MVVRAKFSIDSRSPGLDGDVGAVPIIYRSAGSHRKGLDLCGLQRGENVVLTLDGVSEFAFGVIVNGEADARTRQAGDVAVVMVGNDAICNVGKHFRC